MNTTNAAWLLLFVREILKIITNALAEGRDVSRQEMDALFRRADRADARWHAAGPDDDPPAEPSLTKQEEEPDGTDT